MQDREPRSGGEARSPAGRLCRRSIPCRLAAASSTGVIGHRCREDPWAHLFGSPRTDPTTDHARARIGIRSIREVPATVSRAAADGRWRSQLYSGVDARPRRPGSSMIPRRGLDAVQLLRRDGVKRRPGEGPIAGRRYANDLVCQSPISDVVAAPHPDMLDPCVKHRWLNQATRSISSSFCWKWRMASASTRAWPLEIQPP